MLDALSFGQIRTFVTIVEAGGFRAAGLRLRRAPSAISHAVNALESELGVVLFDRSGHRPILTEAGRTLLEDARSVLLRADFLRARARGLGQGVELELSIVVDSLFPLPLLCAALNHWRLEWPSVHVRLAVEPLGAPLAALRNGRCVMAIMVGEDFQDPGIERESLVALQFVAVVGASHPLAERVRGGASLRTADLSDYLQITQFDPSSLTEGRDFGVLSPQTWRVGSQEIKLALIREGVGWGRMPLWAIADDLAKGNLLRIPTTAFGPDGSSTVQAYLAHKLDNPLGPAATALRTELLRQLVSFSAGGI